MSHLLAICRRCGAPVGHYPADAEPLDVLSWMRSQNDWIRLQYVPGLPSGWGHFHGCDRMEPGALDPP